jgi:predicted NBD/HSP70 family sugar kinase
MHGIDFYKESVTEKERRNIDILEVVRRRGPISRPDISKEMGINVVTVSNYVDEFLKRNLIYEKELDVSEGGRRPVLLDLNSQAGYVIGVGLNLLNMVGVLVDLKGNIVVKTQMNRPRTSVKEISECILDIIREVLKRSKDYTPQIKGVGIGIAGLINKQNGSVHWPQRIERTYTYASVDVPVQQLIEREFNLPALIENDAACACFGEHWFDLDRKVRNALYLFSGVGCGILINGEIYRGSQGYSGETSISSHKDTGELHCSSAKGCFLKRWELDMGILAELHELLAASDQNKKNFLSISSAKDTDGIDLKAVFAAARANDACAINALSAGAERLGIKTAQLVNLLNPEVVVIGGGFEEAGDIFLKKVVETVKEWSFREATDNLTIVYSHLRENAVALGAASLVTQKMFAQLW